MRSTSFSILHIPRPERSSATRGHRPLRHLHFDPRKGRGTLLALLCFTHIPHLMRIGRSQKGHNDTPNVCLFQVHTLFGVERFNQALGKPSAAWPGHRPSVRAPLSGWAALCHRLQPGDPCRGTEQQLSYRDGGTEHRARHSVQHRPAHRRQPGRTDHVQGRLNLLVSSNCASHGLDSGAPCPTGPRNVGAWTSCMMPWLTVARFGF